MAVQSTWVSPGSNILKSPNNHATVFAVLLCAAMSMGTGKPVSHEVCLATWRFVYEPTQNSGDKPRTKRREEIKARPESGSYPKGDAEVVTEHDSDFHQALTQGVDWRTSDS